MKKKNLKTDKLKHDGDCSIYAYGKTICDCGALRKTIRAGRLTGDEPIWIAWVKHVSAIERSAPLC